MTKTRLGEGALPQAQTRGYAPSLDLFAVLLGGATALLPIFARDIFGTGPVGLGFLQMSPAMRGRVSAVHSLFIGTSNQLGQFRAGLTADWFGAVAAVVIGGVATLLVVIGGLKAFPELAGIKSIEGLSAMSSQPE
jgi:hypothetical protein